MGSKDKPEEIGDAPLRMPSPDREDQQALINNVQHAGDNRIACVYSKKKSTWKVE